MLAKEFSLNLVWVPRHSDIPGNELSYKLPKYGPYLPLSPSQKSLNLSLYTCKLTIEELHTKEANLSWGNINAFNVTGTQCPACDRCRLRDHIELQLEVSLQRIYYWVGVPRPFECTIQRYLQYFWGAPTFSEIVGTKLLLYTIFANSDRAFTSVGVPMAPLVVQKILLWLDGLSELMPSSYFNLT